MFCVRSKELRPEAKNFKIFFVHTVSAFIMLWYDKWWKSDICDFAMWFIVCGWPYGQVSSMPCPFWNLFSMLHAYTMLYTSESALMICVVWKLCIYPAANINICVLYMYAFSRTGRITLKIRKATHWSGANRSKKYWSITTAVLWQTLRVPPPSHDECDLTPQILVVCTVSQISRLITGADCCTWT